MFPAHRSEYRLHVLQQPVPLLEICKLAVNQNQQRKMPGSREKAKAVKKADKRR